MGILIRRSINRNNDSSRGVKKVTATPLLPALNMYESWVTRHEYQSLDANSRKFAQIRAIHVTYVTWLILTEMSARIGIQD